VAVGCTGLVPAATLDTACGVAPPDGLGTDVLGLLCATAFVDGDVLLPQFQLFMLSHDGVDQPEAPARQPPAVEIKHIPSALTTAHREIATRMASDPSLVPARAGRFLPGMTAGPMADRQRYRCTHLHLLFSAKAAGTIHLIHKLCRPIPARTVRKVLPPIARFLVRWNSRNVISHGQQQFVRPPSDRDR
jgi:hypothetical protein